MLKILCLTVFFFCGVSVPGAHSQQTLAYQLATLHTQTLNPDQVFLKKTITPESATVREFQWILESLQNRCLNSEEAITQTIYETWQAAKQNQLDLNILDVARELTRATKNTKLFGPEKVNLRMISQFWLVSKVKHLDLDKVVQAYVAQQKQ